MKLLISVLRVGVLVAQLVSLVVLGGCEESLETADERIRPVKSIVINSGSNALRDRVFNGTSKAKQESKLSFRVSGIIKQLPVTVGENLAANQLIAALDNATYELEVQQAKAQLAQANAERRNAEADYLRIRQLYSNENASRTDLDSALARSESANASYNSYAQSLELARLNLSYTRLTSSAHCRIAAVYVELNENVTSGTPVADVNCGEGWEVTINVPESQIGVLRPGLPGTVKFDAIAGSSFKAEITELGVASSSSNTYPVTLSLAQTDPGLRSGLAAEVRFSLVDDTESGSAIYLPPLAVGQDQLGNFVYVLFPAEQAGNFVANRISVEVGEISALGLSILQGLQHGDRIVTAGVSSLRDKQVVRIK